MPGYMKKAGMKKTKKPMMKKAGMKKMKKTKMKKKGQSYAIQ